MNPTIQFDQWDGRLPKASCLCPTFGRPHLLGEAVESFLRQDYPGEKELIILNDHPEMPVFLPSLPGVTVVNAKERYQTLGEKRNAIADLASGDIFLPWDDDDISLPWRLSLSIGKMANCHYFKPSDYWWWTRSGAEYRSGVMAHAMAAYSRRLFEEIGGYPAENSGEDQIIEHRIQTSGYWSTMELGPSEAFYIYRLNHIDTYHISAHGFGGGWEQCAEDVGKRIPLGPKHINPGWDSDYTAATKASFLGWRAPPVPDSPRARLPKILVAICSCHANAAKRSAVRETWLASLPSNITTRFFAGWGPEHPPEQDLVVVDAPDDYESLPGKVLAFFRYALENEHFDYLFKCDDDTYLAPDRLSRLTEGEPDLVGNIRLLDEGFACGGAGYLLARKWVEAVSNLALPATGYEDRIITGGAIGAGAVPTVSKDLIWNTDSYPVPDNSIVTSHWCSPGCLRTIHSLQANTADALAIDVRHAAWQDRVLLFPSGRFARSRKPDGGRWSRRGDAYGLIWDDWDEEIAVPSIQRKARGPQVFECLRHQVETITIELSGGVGNQMFQYAHAAALARRLGADLRLNYSDYARKFSLDAFGLHLDSGQPEPFNLIEVTSSEEPGAEWKSFELIKGGGLRGNVRLRGFFQHESLFDNISGEIRSLFSLPPPSFPPPCDHGVVCVHVRRGDFSGCSKHDLCRPEYFKLAMNIMRNTIPVTSFVVVSDDPEWCRRNLGFSADLAVMEPMDEVSTLAWMSCCGSFILSNSTFGWWAAWMADSDAVIAPTRFINGQTWNICRDSWIQLPPDGSFASSGNKSSTGAT